MDEAQTKELIEELRRLNGHLATGREFEIVRLLFQSTPPITGFGKMFPLGGVAAREDLIPAFVNPVKNWIAVRAFLTDTLSGTVTLALGTTEATIVQRLSGGSGGFLEGNAILLAPAGETGDTIYVGSGDVGVTYTNSEFIRFAICDPFSFLQRLKVGG